MAGLLSPARSSVDRDALLSAELARWASTPFDLAQDNCGLAVLGYAEALSVRRFARGRGLRGARRAARLMAEPHAFVAVASAILRRLGWGEVDAPRRGDIGLVEQPGAQADQIVAAICAEDGGAVPLWAARGDHAVVIQPAVALAIWRH